MVHKKLSFQITNEFYTQTTNLFKTFENWVSRLSTFTVKVLLIWKLITVCRYAASRVTLPYVLSIKHMHTGESFCCTQVCALTVENVAYTIATLRQSGLLNAAAAAAMKIYIKHMCRRVTVLAWKRRCIYIRRVFTQLQAALCCTY